MVVLGGQVGDGLACEEGVDLLAAIEARAGAGRTDRCGKAVDQVPFRDEVAVCAYALLCGEVGQGAHEVATRCHWKSVRGA